MKYEAVGLRDGKVEYCWVLKAGGDFKAHVAGVQGLPMCGAHVDECALEREIGTTLGHEVCHRCKVTEEELLRLAALYELADAAENLATKGGAHEGQCTNVDDQGEHDGDVCDLHIETSDRRKARLLSAVKRFDKEVYRR